MEKSEDRAKLLKGGACECLSPRWTGRKRIQPGWSSQLRLQLTVSLAQNTLRELVGGALVQTALYMSLRVWTEISFSFSACHLKPVEGLRGQACPSVLLGSGLTPPQMQPRGCHPFFLGLKPIEIGWGQGKVSGSYCVLLRSQPKLGEINASSASHGGEPRSPSSGTSPGLAPSSPLCSLLDAFLLSFLSCHIFIPRRKHQGRVFTPTAEGGPNFLQL